MTYFSKVEDASTVIATVIIPVIRDQLWFATLHCFHTFISTTSPPLWPLQWWNADEIIASSLIRFYWFQSLYISFPTLVIMIAESLPLAWLVYISYQSNWEIPICRVTSVPLWAASVLVYQPPYYRLFTVSDCWKPHGFFKSQNCKTNHPPRNYYTSLYYIVLHNNSDLNAVRCFKLYTNK